MQTKAVTSRHGKKYGASKALRKQSNKGKENWAAAKLSQQSYCSKATVAKLLQQSYCSKATAAKLLQQSYCSKATAAKLRQ